jgi:hypothetical protein
MSKKKSKNKNSGNDIGSQPQKTVSKLNVPPALVNSISSDDALLFGKKNFMFLIGGLMLIMIGYLLMAGGNMPSPEVWNENLIYGARRTLIAPIFILAGLVMQVYTIFVRK